MLRCVHPREPVLHDRSEEVPKSLPLFSSVHLARMADVIERLDYRLRVVGIQGRPGARPEDLGEITGERRGREERSRGRCGRGRIRPSKRRTSGGIARISGARYRAIGALLTTPLPKANLRGDGGAVLPWGPASTRSARAET